MSTDDELEELEDLEMLYTDNKSDKHSSKNNFGCCLFSLFCLPFQIFIYMLKSFI